MVDNSLLGVRVGTRSLPNLVSVARDAIANRRGSFIFACANPHSLIVARTDSEFRTALASADAVVADGVGCLWGATLAGVSVGPRITGSDFFVALMSALNRSGGKVFFFGSRSEVLEKLADRLERDFPNVAIAMLSPPFRAWSDEENREMITDIRRFDPDVLWVG